KKLLILLALVALTLAAYWPVTEHGFINYDDDAYIWQNPEVISGLSLENLRWAFTTFHATNWHPLTWLSHQLDCQLFGLQAGLHHLSGLLLHCASVIALYLVLVGLIGATGRNGRLWPCAFVVAIFAIHPTHIESVAWAAERKDVLSTFFWILTMGAYGKYVGVRGSGFRVQGSGFRVQGSHVDPSGAEGRRRARLWYTAALFSFALGLLAKPMLVTLPFVLLLLDYWPLGRVAWARPPSSLPQPEGQQSLAVPPHQKGAKQRKKRKDAQKQTLKTVETNIITPVRRLIVEKVPFLILALASMVVTFIAQREGGAVRSLIEFSLAQRFGNALVSYGAYIVKMLWPTQLTVFYPFAWPLAAWKLIGSAIAIAAISWLSLREWRRRPYLITGWLWYLGTLVPVIGIVQVGNQALANRYTYIPSIGLTWMLAFVVAEWVGTTSGEGRRASGKVRRVETTRPTVVGLIAAVAVLGCVFVTRTELGYWRNSITLFERALAITDGNWVAHNNLAIELERQDRHAEAFDHYLAAVQIAPNYEDARYNFANVLAKQGRFDESEPHYRAALKLNPRHADAHTNFGNVQLARGNMAEAISHFETALSINPNLPEAHNNLGNALDQVGRRPEAIAHYREALRLKPDYPDAHNNLAVSLAGLGVFEKAIEHYRAVLQLDPSYIDAHNNLGVLFVRQGRYPEAIAQFQAVLQANPQHRQARQNLNDALAAQRGEK
ncbi:MAG: tetratricopeptide repeat protein, partial [Verrucomicrobia bacterium]|nr:tetratricopeptide repeat protein [Verrucomicrobiota bacterium]